MKRIVFLIVTVIVLALVGGYASEARAIGLFGAWQNANDLDNGFGVGVTMPIGLGLLRIDPRATWYNYGEPWDVNVYPLDVAAEIDLGIVYGGLGVSYYLIDRDIEDRWGYFAVAGAKLPLGAVTLFADFIWRGSETLESIDFNGGGLNVGIILF